MCRFVVYLGREISLDVLITHPSNSIIHQSFHSEFRREPLNGDGFGVGWFAADGSPDPARFRSIQPAWNDSNLVELARVCRSHCILAHVRAASAGSAVSQANCHPFTARQFAFMHNGDVAGFARLKRMMAARLSDGSYSQIQGTTDSEHLFALFCDHYSEHPDDGATENMAIALAATINDVVSLTAQHMPTQDSFLNLAVTDGVRAVVSRYATGRESPTLYTMRGSQCVCESRQCRMIKSGEDMSSVIIASEPLNQDPGWEVVPHNHLLIVHPDRSLECRSLELS